LVGELRRLDLAEDSDAFDAALVSWRVEMPRNPPAWLLTTARRRATDRLRRARPCSFASSRCSSSMPVRPTRTSMCPTTSASSATSASHCSASAALPRSRRRRDNRIPAALRNAVGWAGNDVERRHLARRMERWQRD